MAGYSARQSSYSSGDTITAAHTNDEFNSILAAFHVSTGHTHDGSTAGDGGPITKLFSNTLTFGAGTAGTDITITFDGESNDGVLKWMEDEDYFEFSDDILIATTEKLQFRDTAIYIHSSADGQLDLVADTEIQIAATTVDINGAVDVSGNLSVGGNLDVTGTFDLSDSNFTNAGNIQLDSISGDADTDTSITFSGSDVITVAAGGDNQVTFTNGAIVPSTDNDIDLGTSSVEFKDAFFDGTVTTDALVADTADINGGTLDGVTIGGSSAAAITGTTITGTSFVIGSADINEAELETIDGVTAGTVSASKAIVADSNKDITGGRNITITGELDAATLDISGNTDIDGDIDVDGTSNLDNTDIDGTLVVDGSNISLDSTSTLNIDNSNTSNGITIGTATSGVPISIGHSTSEVTVNDNLTVTGDLTVSGTTTTVNSTTVNLNDHNLVLDSGNSTSAVVNGAGITIEGGSGDDATFSYSTTGPKFELKLGSSYEDLQVDQLIAASLDISGNVDVDGTLETDALSINGTTVTSTAAELNLVDGITAGTVSASLAVIADSNKDVSGFRNVTLTGELDAATLDISGDADIDGTLETDALSINGTTVTSTAAELNLLDGVSGLVQADFTKLAAVDATAAELNIVDGGTSATSTTVADADRVVLNDNGTMVQVAVTDLAAYFDDEITAMPNLVTTAATTVGALNSGSITSGFGSIDNGSSAITTTGTVTYGSLSDGSITITAFVDEDDMSSNSATLVPTQQSVKAYVDTQITAEDLDITTDSGTIAIDLDSETLTVAGGTGLASSASSNTVTLAVDAAQTGITSVVNTSLEIGRDADNRIKFGTDNQIIFEVSGGDNVIFKASGEIEASSLDISGDADIDGTLEADAVTINGTSTDTLYASPGFAVAMAIAL